jgi:hypothetical protein
MHRLISLLALCALAAAVLALPASAASEKSQVVKYAKKKAAKELAREGWSVGSENITAKCSDKGSYWKCTIDGNGGQCNGTLRVFGSGGKYTAPKKYVSVGCIADKVAAAGQQGGGDAEKQYVTSYAKKVFKRKTKKSGITLKSSDIKGSCTTNASIAYWKCHLTASHSAGVCDITMRVYDALGKAHASKIKVGCSG